MVRLVGDETVLRLSRALTVLEFSPNLLMRPRPWRGSLTTPEVVGVGEDELSSADGSVVLTGGSRRCVCSYRFEWARRWGTSRAMVPVGTNPMHATVISMMMSRSTRVGKRRNNEAHPPAMRHAR